MTAAIVAFAVGVWWLQQRATLPTFPPDPAWLWAACACAGLSLVRPLRRWLVLPAAFALGFAWAAGCAHLRMHDRLAAELEGRDLVLSGVVASLPAVGERSVRFEFDVEAAPGPGVPGRILLSWYRSGIAAGPEDAPAALDDPYAVHPGERWLFTVRLKRPHGSVNPHGFDYEGWLLERGIGASGYVRQRGGQRKIGERNSVVDRIEQARERVRARFLDVLGDSDTAGILVALVVGDQRAIDAGDWRLFSRTGVTHLMSISGLHVTLISGMVAALVAFGWRRSGSLALVLPARKAAALAATFAALAYTLLAGFGVPAQRTFFMVGAVAAALWSGRISSPSRVLALALLAVVLVDPWAVLAAGFWLSFGAVALIFYVSHGWTGRASWLAQWARVQWAITVGLAPMALLLFSQVSLVGPLANAVAIPVVSAVITPLALASALLPADALLRFADVLAGWLMVFLAWCDALPVAVWQQAVPPAWAVAAALAGVLWLLAPRGMPSRWIGLAFFLPVLTATPPRPAPGEAWVTTLDVGQGLAVLVRTAEHNLLYDAGPAYGTESDSGERIIAPYLRAIGALRLDTMVVTHNDSDHSGGAISVLQNAQVLDFMSSLEPDNPIALAAPGPRPCVRGDRWQWDGVEFEVMHPARDDYADGSLRINNLSCVLRVATAHGSMLLTGDIEKVAEALLVQREGAGLRADALLAPHHGSRTSSTAEFIDAVRPALLVVPAGYRNRFGHPRADVLARYAVAGTRVLRTDLDGAVTVRLARDGVQALGERAGRPRYWQAARL
ncbi:MAG: DNA internalization-related competence protein ComEC/Rec2 [Proteobacteria bacterium]|nr:DNA internalization-related competence protein ComEC/Rec2 [Pseudomonadota bacterium]